MESYERKYLKYKNKYLNLKQQQMGGGDNYKIIYLAYELSKILYNLTTTIKLNYEYVNLYTSYLERKKNDEKMKYKYEYILKVNEIYKSIWRRISTDNYMNKVIIDFLRTIPENDLSKELAKDSNQALYNFSVIVYNYINHRYINIKNIYGESKKVLFTIADYVPKSKIRVVMRKKNYDVEIPKEFSEIDTEIIVDIADTEYNLFFGLLQLCFLAIGTVLLIYIEKLKLIPNNLNVPCYDIYTRQFETNFINQISEASKYYNVEKNYSNLSKNYNNMNTAIMKYALVMGPLYAEIKKYLKNKTNIENMNMAETMNGIKIYIDELNKYGDDILKHNRAIAEKKLPNETYDEYMTRIYGDSRIFITEECGIQGYDKCPLPCERIEESTAFFGFGTVPKKCEYNPQSWSLLL